MIFLIYPESSHFKCQTYDRLNISQCRTSGITDKSKSEAPKDLCMVDLFVGGRYVDSCTNAHLVPEMSPELKAAGITEYSNTAGQREGSCYRKKNLVKSAGIV